MLKVYKLTLTVIFLSALAVSSSAQNKFFTDAGADHDISSPGFRVLAPNHFRNASLDLQAMKSFLWSLPSEAAARANRSQMPVLELPMPDGSIAKFRVWESSVMAPALAAKFPEMKTFAGQGITDPYATIRFDYNPYFGFSAQVLSSVTGRIFIDPYARWDKDHYISYYAKDASASSAFSCNATDIPLIEQVAAGPCRGTQLSTYRLALACTGEYAAAVSAPNPATIASTAAAMLTAVNRVTGVYETETASRMVLVPNNDLLIYLDPTTDPYTNNSGSTMLGQNVTNLNTIIGNANFDIGHVFSTGGGGIAGLGVVCTSNKARGVTGLPNPVGDPFYIDYVAHEMGHQFGGSHTFNSVTGSCNGNRSAGQAYEVGSATSIQGYAGICGTDNIQPNSDPFFHTISFDQISNLIAGVASCGVLTATNNSIPVITSMDNNGANIPLSTPFTLTGSATDADNDPITYNWEEWDLGPAGAWNSGATSTTAPLFKSRAPKNTGDRTFPDINVILAGYPANPTATMGGLKGETLPTVARAMKFRLTVRDNRAGGGGVVTGGDGCGTFTSQFQINTIAGTGPFLVTIPNGGESYQSGSVQTVTWNVAGTDAAPISTANVKITMSTDGGFTYPFLIADNTPNDGSQAVVMPSVTTSTARIKIEAVGNIYFDISNANFFLTPPPNSFDFGLPAAVVASCPAGPSMSANLTTVQNGTFSTPIVLTAAGNPAGTTVTFSPNPVNPGSSTTVTLNNTNTLNAGSYVVTVTGTAGSVVRTRDITFTITAGAGPAITNQPPNRTICAGGNTTFTVTAATATAFQWQVSSDGGANWTNVSNTGVYTGATTSTLTLTGAGAGLNNNQYRVIASFQCGSTTSSVGVLTVNLPPAITTQPASVTLCAGGNQTFSVAATGGGLTYQWQLSTTGCGGPWTNITGATASSLSLTNITASMNGYAYQVIVTGTCAPAVTSACASLTVVTSVNITTQPVNASVCVGGSTSFTVVGSGSGIIYQWQVSTDGGANWTNVVDGGFYSGATTGTLTVSGATTALNNNRYRALVSNATCTTPGTSNSALLTVNTLPAITTQPTSVTICVGANTSFTSGATGTGVGYQWQVSTDNGANWTNISNGGVYSGATTTTLTITGATASMNTYRYRMVASGTCTPAAVSNNAILTVISPVNITGQPAASVNCSNSNTSFTVAGTSVETIVYQWQVSTDGGANWNNVTNSGIYTGANASTLTLTGIPVTLNNARYRALLSSATCSAPSTSNSALLTVRQTPTVSLSATPLTTLLPGQLTTLTALPSVSTGGTLTTTWQFNGGAPSPPITGNSYVANIEHVGTYQVFIQETFTNPSLVCSNQSSIVTIEAAVSPRLFIFPTPNDGRFSVAYYNNGGTTTTRKIVIYDSKGSMVYSRSFAVTGLYTLMNIDIQSASRGIYYVVVGDASGKKLVDGKVHIR